MLYAVAETDDGHVHAWSLADGAPAEPLGRGETGGAEPAHLTVDSSGRFLVTANYSGGSISVHRLGAGRQHRRAHRPGPARGSTASSPRQEQAHPHMVRAIGGGAAGHRPRRRRDLPVPASATTASSRWTASSPRPPGSGPRHVLPVGDRYYLTAELSGELLGLRRRRQLARRRAGQQAPTAANQPSELASDGRFLYVANRGPNTVTVFALDERPAAVRHRGRRRRLAAAHRSRRRPAVCRQRAVARGDGAAHRPGDRHPGARADDQGAESDRRPAVTPRAAGNARARQQPTGGPGPATSGWRRAACRPARRTPSPTCPASGSGTPP